jgi:hypothetical protein
MEGHCKVCNSKKVEFHQPIVTEGGSNDMAPLCRNCYHAFHYGWEMAVAWNLHNFKDEYQQTLDDFGFGKYREVKE